MDAVAGSYIRIDLHNYGVYCVKGSIKLTCALRRYLLHVKVLIFLLYMPYKYAINHLRNSHGNSLIIVLSEDWKLRMNV